MNVSMKIPPEITNLYFLKGEKLKRYYLTYNKLWSNNKKEKKKQNLFLYPDSSIVNISFQLLYHLYIIFLHTQTYKHTHFFKKRTTEGKWVICIMSLIPKYISIHFLRKGIFFYTSSIVSDVLLNWICPESKEEFLKTRNVQTIDIFWKSPETNLK